MLKCLSRIHHNNHREDETIEDWTGGSLEPLRSSPEKPNHWTGDKDGD